MSKNHGMPVQYGYSDDIKYPLIGDIRLVTQLANATSQTILSQKRASTFLKCRMLTIWLWTAWNEARSNARLCEHLQLVRLIPNKIVQILWWMEQIANAIFYESTLKLYVLFIFRSTSAKL